MVGGAEACSRLRALCRGLSPAERDANGLGEGVFRVSVGVEEIGALTEAFRAAVAAAARA